MGCSPRGREESDTIERLPFHFSLSCTGEGNGNPLQCSCLENPRDGGTWWAAIYGVAQSRTRLKRLSSSSSSRATESQLSAYCFCYEICQQGSQPDTIKFLSKCDWDKNSLVNSIAIIIFWKHPSKTVSPNFGKLKPT